MDDLSATWEGYYLSAYEASKRAGLSPEHINELYLRVVGLSKQYANCLGKVEVLSNSIVGYDWSCVRFDTNGDSYRNLGGDCVELTARFIQGLTYEARNAVDMGDYTTLGAQLALTGAEISFAQCYAPWFFRRSNGFRHTVCTINVGKTGLLVDPSMGVVMDSDLAYNAGYEIIDKESRQLDWINQSIITPPTRDLLNGEYSGKIISKSGRAMVLVIDDELMVVYSVGYMRERMLRKLYPFIQIISTDGDTAIFANTPRGIESLDLGFIAAHSEAAEITDVVDNAYQMSSQLPILEY